MVLQVPVLFTKPLYMRYAKSTDEKLSLWPIIATMVAGFVTGLIALIIALFVVI